MTMTTWLERAPAERITERAREVRLGVTLLRLAAFLLICLGRAAAYAWLVPVWCALAVREGWRDVYPAEGGGHGRRA
jgi:hypothetical protein